MLQERIVLGTSSKENQNKSGASVEVRGVSKNYGKLEVLRNFSLAADVGEFITLIGPSGSGKSTLFNILTGLEEADQGRILVNGQAVQPGSFAYMPQRDTLLPWRTILDNTALGLELQGTPKKVAREQAAGLFGEFGLNGFEKSYPFELSGGMRQRAALLRTILTQRPILLLDEPFGALDALTRSGLHQWLLDLQTRLRRTIIFITHDVEEALLLSDRVYVLSSRPAQVKLVHPVDLPQPRRLDLVTTPEFVEQKATLLKVMSSAL